MAMTIKCKNCGAEIEVTDALTHDIQEKAKKEAEATLLKETEEKFKSEFSEKVHLIEKEKDEERERNKKLSKELESLLDEIRSLRRKDEEREIELKKKVMESEEKVRLEERKRSEEEHQLKDVEKEKMIDDLKKALSDAQKKASQGSQQTQGEVLELTIEKKLKEEYPQDEILEVKKGVRGADVIQKVFDKNGNNCGSIIWESKNAKWSESWILKLKEDQRQAKSDICVLVSVELPKEIAEKGIGYRNGVWIVGPNNFLNLALSLRFNLVSLYHEKENSTNIDEKMKVLYKYLTGNEFKHRVEGIVEAFSVLQEDIEKEKRYFSVKWARQEKEIRKVIDHTHGMYGDLQGVTGRNLPQIKSLSDSNQE